MKRIFTLLCLSLAICNQATTQSISFQTLLDSSFSPGAKYALVGKFQNKILLLSLDFDKGTNLIVYDEQENSLHQKTYDFIDDKSILHVVPGRGTKYWHMVFQYTDNEMYYTGKLTLDGKGDIVQGIKMIDSVAFEKLGNNAYYSLTNDRNENYYLLYRIIEYPSSKEVAINYVLLDRNANPFGSRSFNVPLDSKFEVISDVFVAPNGAVYFAIHDKADNYRLGSKLRLYRSELQNQQPALTEIYLKQNKPIRFAFDADSANKFVALGALYANFYNENIDGALTVLYNPASNRVDTVVYMAMEKEFKKEVRKGISSIPTKDLIKMTELVYFRVNPDRSISTVAGLLSLRQYATGTVSNNTFSTTRGSSAFGAPVNPSQSFDQLRNDIALTTLPPPGESGGRRSSSRTQAVVGGTATGSNNVFAQQRPLNSSDWNNQMNRMQYLGPNSQEIFNSYYDNAFSQAIADNRMVSKSIVFSLNSDHKDHWKTIVRNLYISNTPFTNLTAIPLQNNVGLINYELSAKKQFFLQQKTFTPEGHLITHELCPPGSPLLFYNGCMLRVSEKEMLTMFLDPVRNRVGLARINW